LSTSRLTKRGQSRAGSASLETDADIVAVGCPFCMTMLEDGINARKGDRDMPVMDVAELLWKAVQSAAPQNPKT